MLGHSRYIFARFVMHQDLQTLLRCHMQAFAAIGGVPIEILYDRMKTAVTGEDGDGHIVYNRSLLALAQHYGFLPEACRPYRAKTKGKVERPFSYIRQDFFLARTLPQPRRSQRPARRLARHRRQRPGARHDAARRRRGLRRRAARAAVAARRSPFDALLKLERRVSHDGLVSIGGNYYSVPDRTRRVVEVHQLPDLIRILDQGRLVAEHPVLEGRRQTASRQPSPGSAARASRYCPAKRGVDRPHRRSRSAPIAGHLSGDRRRLATSGGRP